MSHRHSVFLFPTTVIKETKTKITVRMSRFNFSKFRDFGVAKVYLVRREDPCTNGLTKYFKGEYEVEKVLRKWSWSHGFLFQQCVLKRVDEDESCQMSKVQTHIEVANNSQH